MKSVLVLISVVAIILLLLMIYADGWDLGREDVAKAECSAAGYTDSHVTHDSRVQCRTVDSFKTLSRDSK